MDGENLELFSRLKKPEERKNVNPLGALFKQLFPSKNPWFTDKLFDALDQWRPKMETGKFIEQLQSQPSEQMVILITENKKRDKFKWYPEPEVVQLKDQYQSYTAIRCDALSDEVYDYPKKGVKEIPLDSFRKLHSLADDLAYYFREPGLSEGQTEHTLKPLKFDESELENLRDTVLELHDLILDLDVEQIKTDNDDGGVDL